MLIIGIAGGTGCGKTTVVNKIIDELPDRDVGIISQDSYYNDLSHLSMDERKKVNFDHPHAIDFELLSSHLEELRKGNTIEQPEYSFIEHNRTGKTHIVKPTKVLIVEGILIMTDPRLRSLYDIKIFVHADSDERLIRRLKRDTTERGRDASEVLEWYQNTLKPMHEQFIEPCKEHCDIIIPNNHYNTVAIDIVKTIISHKFI